VTSLSLLSLAVPLAVFIYLAVGGYCLLSQLLKGLLSQLLKGLLSYFLNG
jgi:hypothetical protein